MLSSGSCSWVRGGGRLPGPEDDTLDFIAAANATCEPVWPPTPLNLLKHPATDGVRLLLWSRHAGRALLLAVVAVAPAVVVWLLRSSRRELDGPIEVSRRERMGLANASAKRVVRTILLDPWRMLLSPLPATRCVARSS